PAPVDRARLREGRAGPDPRRAHQRAGRRERARHPGRAGPAHERPHDADHRPSAVDRPPRRPDRRAPGRRRRRAGHTRRAPRAPPGVRAPARAAGGALVKATRGPVVVFGIAFLYPLAGVTWQFLHYLVGLRRLGFDPYYVEDSSRWVYDPALGDFTPDPARNIAAVLPALQAHGFGDRWACRVHALDGRCYGLPQSRLRALYRDAVAMLNVTGAQEVREEHLGGARRLYVETDPVASQLGVAEGDPKTIEQLAAHDVLFTYGENLGRPDCGVPIERFTWQPTRQPVVLDFWPPAPPTEHAPYTTIATWRHQNDRVFRGETYYWSKEREFLKVLDLPRRCPAPIELALDITPDAPQTEPLLREHGWRVVPAADVSRDVM